MIETLFLVVLLLYYFCWLKILDRFFERRVGNILVDIAIGFSYVGISMLLDKMQLHRLGILYTAFFFIIVIKILYKANFWNYLNFGVSFVLLPYSIRAMIGGVFSLMLDQIVNVTLSESPTRYFIFVLTYVSISIFLYYSSKSIGFVNSNKKFNRNTNQVKKITIFQTIMLIYLLVINDGRFLRSTVMYLSGANQWFTILYLVSSIFVLSLLILIWVDTVRVARYIEEQKYTVQLEQQLYLQINHYKSYTNWVKNFDKFKHDYRNVLKTIDILIDRNNVDEAKAAINEFTEKLGEEVIAQTYSKNVVIDAILHDVYERCIDNNIKFDVDMRIPELKNISELGLLRAGTNILNNAFEAVSNVKELDKRYITVKGEVVNNWILFQTENSYETNVVTENQNYVSTKKEEGVHGIGLKIVKEIIEDMGGVFTIVNNEKVKIFTVKVYIPMEGFK